MKNLMNVYQPLLCSFVFLATFALKQWRKQLLWYHLSRYVLFIHFSPCKYICIVLPFVIFLGWICHHLHTWYTVIHASADTTGETELI